MCALTRSTDGADGLTLHARVVAVERHDLAVDEVLVDLVPAAMVTPLVVIWPLRWVP